MSMEGVSVQGKLVAEIARLKAELISVKLSCPDCNEIRAAWQSDIAERDARLAAAKGRIKELEGDYASMVEAWRLASHD